MKYLYFVLCITVFIFISKSSFSQWNVVFSGETTTFNGSYTVNQNTAYVVGEYGKCYKTTNGGFSWLAANPGAAYTLYTMAFADGLNGIITASNGVYFLTDNGGASWGQYNTGTIYPIYSVKYYNANKFALAGQGGLLRVYTNGNLTGQYSGANNFQAVTFLDSSSLLAVGLSGVMTRSTNSGATFIGVASPTSNDLFAVSFANANTGYAAGSYGTILKTTNGGTVWSSLNSGVTYWLYGISFVNANTGYACGENGTLTKTTNGGASWFAQVSNSLQTLKSINVRSDNLGYCVGISGTVLKTTNAGASFVSQISNEIPKQFELKQNYPNPFNPSTKISFSVPYKNFVSIKVFDIDGHEVSDLIEKEFEPGKYEAEFNAEKLSSGIYYYTLRTENFSETKKMILVR